MVEYLIILLLYTNGIIMYIIHSCDFLQYTCINVTGPVKINHVSAKEWLIFSYLPYHNLQTIYILT